MMLAAASVDGTRRALDPAGKYSLVARGDSGAAVEAAISGSDGIKSDRASLVMVTMSSNLQKVESQVPGDAINIQVEKNCFLGFFTARIPFYMTHYRLASGKEESGNVLLALPAPKDTIALLELDYDTPWHVLVNHFVAADEEVALETRHLPMVLEPNPKKAERICVYEARGPGRLLISGTGSMTSYDLHAGEQRSVADVRYAIAWTNTTRFTCSETKPGTNSITFTGPGTVYIQARIQGVSQAGTVA